MIKNKYLIGISGKKRSGKDEFAKIFNECLSKQFKFKYNVKKFAGKLKEICSLLTGKPLEWFYSGEYCDMFLPEWGMTIRELQQKVGTEAFRNNVYENTWINALFSDYNKEQRWIITDVRFPNEANAIKEQNGILVRINRPYLISNDIHPSEISLDNYKDFDYYIENKDLLDYKKQILKFIEKNKI